MVFAIVFLIQTTVCVFVINAYKGEQLEGLRETARAALVAAIVNNTRGRADEAPASPFSKQEGARLITHTTIKGLAVYDLRNSLIQSYGAPPLFNPDRNNQIPFNTPASDNPYYEALFTSDEMGHPYNIVVKLDAKNIVSRVAAHTRQSLFILFLITLFVTGILMLAMSQMLLTPLLRQNDATLQQLHKQAEDKIYKFAYFDSLTGLPNQTYLLEHMAEAIKYKTFDQDAVVAVLSVDLDHFKDINDAMGQETGDRLLKIVSQRLVKAMPENALVARSSADEFIIMVVLKPDQPDSAALAENFFAAMQNPVQIDEENFLVRASIGVSHYPADGADAHQILENADLALHRAKEEGRATVRYYSQGFDLEVQQKSQMLRDLRGALEQKQLQLHYHPQFDIKTGEIVGAEALLRWWRPDSSKAGGKFIPPLEFIPMAEHSGLIVPIGEFVLRTACATNKMWQNKGLPPFRIAVNVSGVQFHRSDIVKLAGDILRETNLEPQWLELEITESVFMEDMQMAIDILDQLHQQGIQLAIDDFGTGYSSLSYLRQFPIDHLKIDQSFVRASLININDRMIIQAIITLAQSLNLKIIAEGVETKDHEDLLKEEGCDEAQGFKYTKPLPADKFWDFVIAHNNALAKSGKG